MSPKLKEQLSDYLRKPSDLSLSEAKAREQHFEALPDELFEMAEEMSPPGASFVDKLENAHKIMVEAVKLAEAWPGDGPAARIASAVKPSAPADGEPSLSYRDSRPDVQLAELANEIRLSESVGYGKAMRLACERDPGLAARYKADCFGPATTSSTDRPDVELADRAKARAEKDGVDYGKAMGLELSENPALAKRYHERCLGGAAPESSVKVKPPRGMRLVSERPDVQLAERMKARQKRDGVDSAKAMGLELAEDPALASRYADYQAGRTALQEATYRAETIRAAHHGRFSLEKAFNAALAEDPKLRAGVDAYYVRT